MSPNAVAERRRFTTARFTTAVPPLSMEPCVAQHSFLDLRIILCTCASAWDTSTAEHFVTRHSFDEVLDTNDSVSHVMCPSDVGSGAHAA